MGIKLYDLYNQVKQYFVRPRLIFYHGPWWKSSGLPVWRDNTWVWAKWGTYKWVLGEYGWLNEYKEKHRLITRFPPAIKFPMWLSFHIFNFGTTYKYKYCDPRFEFRPQFTIVLFGYSFNWFLVAPGDPMHEDDYWEALIRCKDAGRFDLEEQMYANGYWTIGYKTRGLCLNPDYLKEPYRTRARELAPKVLERLETDTK